MIRPSHARDLVGECNRRHLCRAAIHYSGEPMPSQIAIALFGDAAEPCFAAGRVLLGPVPRRTMAAGGGSPWRVPQRLYEIHLIIETPLV